MQFRQLSALICAMCIAFVSTAQVVSIIDQQLAPIVASGAAQADTSSNTSSNSGIVARLLTLPEKAKAINRIAAPSETYIEEMAVLINTLRQSNGMPPVKINIQLSNAAQSYAQRMSTQQFFGHNDPDNNCSKPYERIQSSGYSGWTHASENIAAGQATATEAMQALQASPSHLKTLLNPNLREVGVGFVIELSDTDDVRIISTCPNFDRRGGPYLYYWVQDFASRQISPTVPLLPVIINNEAFATEVREVDLYIYGGANGQAQWANEMRFSQDGVTWTEYEPWQPTRRFSFTGDFGLRTVYVELKHIDPNTSAESTQIVSDTVYLEDPNNPTTIVKSFVFLPAMVR